MIKNILFFGILMVLSSSCSAGMTGTTDLDDNLSKLGVVVDLLKENYVDSVDINTLQEAAIKGGLRSLDPHSIYISPEEFRERGESEDGKLCGVGLEVTVRNGILTVVTAIEGMSAYKQGMRSGDQIWLINGKSLRGKPLEQMAASLRGGVGSEVILTVQSRGTTRRKEILLVREELPEGAVYSKRISPGILYVRIYLFTSKTTKDVRRSVNLALKKPLTGIILDLRDNPGGPLEQAVHVTDIFLNSGRIVSVQEGTNKMNRVFEAHSGGRAGEVPMVVLVNGSTASSAEIVTAALQEQKRAIVVGTKTFGKGTVQNIFRLKNGAALQITTGRYYTASGRSLQGTGVMPDISVESSVNHGQVLKAKGNGNKEEWADLQLDMARSILMSLNRIQDDMVGKQLPRR